MPRANRGFTIIELLIVIAIIGLLIQLLLPAIQNSRESARRAHCTNNLRQLGIGILNYETARKTLPPGHTAETPKHNFTQFILAYIGEPTIHSRYNFDFDWDDEVNKFAVETEISLVQCPSAPRQYSFVGDYGIFARLNPALEKAMVGDGYISDRDSRGLLRRHERKISAVEDGMSRTVLICETGGRPDKYERGVLISRGRIDGAEWASSSNWFDVHHRCGGAVMDEGPQIMNCSSANEIHSFHSAGCNFVFGDASVQYLMEDIDPETLVSLLTSNGED